MCFINRLFGKSDETVSSNPKIATLFPFIKQIEIDSNDITKEPFILSDAKVKVVTGVANINGKEIKLELIEKNSLPDCIVMYGFDKGEVFTQIKSADFDHDITLGSLDEIAFNNVRKVITKDIPLQIKDLGNGLSMFICGGNYESTLIYFDDILRDIQKEYGEDILIAVIARDIVLFSPASKAEIWVEKKNVLQTQFESHPKPLSKFLYRVHGNEWVIVNQIIR